jgi:hypothetical protein
MPRGAAIVVESRRETARIMRIRAFCTIALMACGAAVLSQGAAVPISQEHHHHLVIDNQYIRAYEVEVAPHEPTLLHRHDQDYIYVVFGDADITNAVEGKPEIKAHLADTTVNLARGPLVHIAHNDGNTSFRNITIQLLPKIGEMKSNYPSVTAALDAAAIQDAGNIVARSKSWIEATIMESREMRVLAIRVSPGGAWEPSSPRRPSLVVWMGRWRENLDAANPDAAIFPIRMETWFTNQEKVSIRNTTRMPLDVLILEFED